MGLSKFLKEKNKELRREVKTKARIAKREAKRVKRLRQACRNLKAFKGKEEKNEEKN